jgi:hypothetical protein
MRRQKRPTAVDLFGLVQAAFAGDGRLAQFFDAERRGSRVRIVSRLLPDCAFDIGSWAEFERWLRWLDAPVSGVGVGQSRP